MLTLSQIKKSPKIKEFIAKSEKAAEMMDYTDHGFRHSNLVAERAREIAKKIGLTRGQQELAAIAGYCHDMGFFLGRDQHHYWATFLFGQVFLPGVSARDIQGLTTIMQAIVNHDKIDIKIFNRVSACVILADKSDVHRGRVTSRSMAKIKRDIHDRVNYAVTESKIFIEGNKKPVARDKKRILLKMKIDTKFCPVMEYFEIFTGRMSFCREASNFLGYKFGLEINRFKLL